MHRSNNHQRKQAVLQTPWVAAIARSEDESEQVSPDDLTMAIGFDRLNEDIAKILERGGPGPDGEEIDDDRSIVDEDEGDLGSAFLR